MISFVDGYYGWLGNQMFQYAATKALALHHSTECSFPQNRPNLHQIFRLRALPKLRYYPPENVYREKHYHHDPDFWGLPNNTELSGYFQSDKYFAPFEAEIRSDFSPPMKNWTVVSAVSVHVRRGDYLSFPDHHPPCTVDYYREAMAQFKGHSFVVFSDDPGWCLLNIKPLAEQVEIVTGQSAINDMWSMGACQHHIIANSSFSWWGAWLGRNPFKRVIAPKAWFGPLKQGWDTKDLLPAGWMTL